MSKTNIPQRNDRQDLHHTIESFRIWQLSPTWNAKSQSLKKKPPRTSNRFLSFVKQCFGRGNIPQEVQDRNLYIDIRVESAIILKIIYRQITLMLSPIGNNEDSQNFWLWNILSYLCDEQRSVSLGFREENHHCVTPFLKFNDQLVCCVVAQQLEVGYDPNGTQNHYLAVDRLDDNGKLVQNRRIRVGYEKAYSLVNLNENTIAICVERNLNVAPCLLIANPNTGARHMAARYFSDRMVRLNNNQIISWNNNNSCLCLTDFSEFNWTETHPFDVNRGQIHHWRLPSCGQVWPGGLLMPNHIQSIVRLTDTKFAIATKAFVIIYHLDNHGHYHKHQILKNSSISASRATLTLTPIRLLIEVNENLIAYVKKKDEITVWDLNSEEPRILKGHTGKISTLFKLNDTTIVSGGFDQTLRVWDLKNDTVRVLKGHKGTIGSVKKVNDNMIISQSYDYTLRVWDLTKDTSRVLDRALPVFDYALPIDNVIITSKMVKNREILSTETLDPCQSVFNSN